jgi:ABC-type molybdate transport system ATPase subunit
MLVVEVEKKLGEFSLNVLFASETGATVLFGPSGAGKTTVVNMIAGLLRRASTSRSGAVASATCSRKAGCFRTSA